jgi:hypothetical protein
MISLLKAVKWCINSRSSIQAWFVNANTALRSIAPVRTCIGLYSFESGGLLDEDILDALAVAVVYAAAAVASCEDVRVEWLETDIAGLRGLGFASSRWTLGPPAREHGTLCLVQFEQGDCSSHCESERESALSAPPELTK